MAEYVDVGPPDFAVSQEPGVGITIATGPRVPADGEDGFAPSCLYLQTDASTASTRVYVNHGTRDSANFDAGQLTTIAQREIAIPLSSAVVWDAPQTRLGTAGNDDLGMTGTWGADTVYLTSGTVSAASATRYGRVEFAIPSNFVINEDLYLRVEVDEANAAEVSATVDVEVTSSTHDPTTDIVTTAATSVVGGGFKDFVIDYATVHVGDILDIRFALAVDDTGGTGAVYNIVSASLYLPTIV